MNRNAHALRRTACFLLAALLLVTSTPATAETDHGFVTADRVNFRPSPTTSDFWDRLDTGWAAEILDTVMVGDVLWYKVKTNIPTLPNRSYTGYIHGNFFRRMTEEEETAWLANPVQGGVSVPVTEKTPAPIPDDETNPEAPEDSGGAGYAVITVDGANLRTEPSVGSGEAITALSKDLVVKVLESPDPEAADSWYKVSVLGYTGYMSANHLRVLSDAEAAALMDGGSTEAPSSTPDSYVRLIKPGVNLRKTPGGESQMQLPQNRVLPSFGTPVSQLGYSWAYVRDPSSGVYGYVRSDCYIFTDSAGKVVTPAPTPTPTPGVTSPPSGASGYIKLIKGGVNLRRDAAGLSIAQLDKGTEMPYFATAQAGGYSWYYVISPKGAGYIRADMAIVTEGSGIPDTPGTPLPTDEPLGYIVTTKAGVNLRATAQTSGSVLRQVAKQTVWPMIGPVVMASGYTWFYVSVEGRRGYLRGDCVRQMTDLEVAAYLSSGQIPPIDPPGSSGSDGVTGHIITTYTSVNIRVAPSLDAKQLTQVAEKGKVFDYITTVTSGGKPWYRILYAGQVAYMMGSYARIMTAAEYQEYMGTQPTPTPTPEPTPTPRPEDMSSTAITQLERVLVRKSGSMSAQTLTILYKKGTICTLTGTTVKAEGYTWYQAKAGGVTGWIRGDVIRILTKEEARLLEAAGDPDAPREASYRTLNKGSTGEDVTRLQTELKRLGFLTANGVTGTYTTETSDAVRAYQRAAGLVVDGIAGALTQHKLYGTVPEGTYGGGGGSTVTPVLYPVEMVDWYTGDIQTVWARGVVAVVTDVKTGISLRIKRWSGGSHVDGEPLTAADTAALCKIYGVKNAQEISDKNLYQRRPLWVTVGGRTFAASLYGVPHNYPDGDTIPDNDFNGQLCIHFLNSRTHSSSTVDPDHMAAIRYAYDHAASRK